MKTREAFILGHSHTVALSKALPHFASDISFVVEWLWGKSGVANVRGTIKPADAEKKIESLTQDDALFLSVLGTRHNKLSLIESEKPFSIGLAQPHREGVTMIPEKTFVAELESSYETPNTVKGLCEKAICPVFHLAPPPPKKDNEFLLAHASLFRNNPNFRPSEPDLRLRVWSVEMQVVEKRLAEFGVRLLWPPQKALTDEGFLSPEYYHTDGIHANQKYGGLVLEQVVEIMGP